MVDKYTYVKRFTLEAKTENPSPIQINIDNLPDRYDSFDYDYPLPGTRQMSLTGIYLADWDLTIKYERTDRFKRVAEIVGEEKAQQVLEALDRRD